MNKDEKSDSDEFLFIEDDSSSSSYRPKTPSLVSFDDLLKTIDKSIEPIEANSKCDIRNSVNSQKLNNDVSSSKEDSFSLKTHGDSSDISSKDLLNASDHDIFLNPFTFKNVSHSPKKHRDSSDSNSVELPSLDTFIEGNKLPLDIGIQSKSNFNENLSSKSRTSSTSNFDEFSKSCSISPSLLEQMKASNLKTCSVILHKLSNQDSKVHFIHKRKREHLSTSDSEIEGSGIGSTSNVPSFEILPEGHLAHANNKATSKLEVTLGIKSENSKGSTIQLNEGFNPISKKCFSKEKYPKNSSYKSRTRKKKRTAANVSSKMFEDEEITTRDSAETLSVSEKQMNLDSSQDEQNVSQITSSKLVEKANSEISEEISGKVNLGNKQFVKASNCIISKDQHVDQENKLNVKKNSKLKIKMEKKALSNKSAVIFKMKKSQIKSHSGNLLEPELNVKVDSIGGMFPEIKPCKIELYPSSSFKSSITESAANFTEKMIKKSSSKLKVADKTNTFTKKKTIHKTFPKGFKDMNNHHISLLTKPCFVLLHPLDDFSISNPSIDPKLKCCKNLTNHNKKIRKNNIKKFTEKSDIKNFTFKTLSVDDNIDGNESEIEQKSTMKNSLTPRKKSIKLTNTKPSEESDNEVDESEIDQERNKKGRSKAEKKFKKFSNENLSEESDVEDSSYMTLPVDDKIKNSESDDDQVNIKKGRIRSKKKSQNISSVKLSEDSDDDNKNCRTISADDQIKSSDSEVVQKSVKKSRLKTKKKSKKFTDEKLSGESDDEVDDTKSSESEIEHKSIKKGKSKAEKKIKNFTNGNLSVESDVEDSSYTTLPVDDKIKNSESEDDQVNIKKGRIRAKKKSQKISSAKLSEDSDDDNKNSRTISVDDQIKSSDSEVAQKSVKKSRSKTKKKSKKFTNEKLSGESGDEVDDTKSSESEIEHKSIKKGKSKAEKKLKKFTNENLSEESDVEDYSYKTLPVVDKIKTSESEDDKLNIKKGRIKAKKKSQKISSAKLSEDSDVDNKICRTLSVDDQIKSSKSEVVHKSIKKSRLTTKKKSKNTDGKLSEESGAENSSYKTLPVDNKNKTIKSEDDKQENIHTGRRRATKSQKMSNAKIHEESDVKNKNSKTLSMNHKIKSSESEIEQENINNFRLTTKKKSKPFSNVNLSEESDVEDSSYKTLPIDRKITTNESEYKQEKNRKGQRTKKKSQIISSVILFEEMGVKNKSSRTLSIDEEIKSNESEMEQETIKNSRLTTKKKSQKISSTKLPEKYNVNKSSRTESIDDQIEFSEAKVVQKSRLRGKRKPKTFSIRKLSEESDVENSSYKTLPVDNKIKTNESEDKQEKSHKDQRRTKKSQISSVKLSEEADVKSKSSRTLSIDDKIISSESEMEQENIKKGRRRNKKKSQKISSAKLSEESDFENSTHKTLSLGGKIKSSESEMEQKYIKNSKLTTKKKSKPFNNIARLSEESLPGDSIIKTLSVDKIKSSESEVEHENIKKGRLRLRRESATKSFSEQSDSQKLVEKASKNIKLSRNLKKDCESETQKCAESESIKNVKSCSISRINVDRNMSTKKKQDMEGEFSREETFGNKIKRQSQKQQDKQRKYISNKSNIDINFSQRTMQENFNLLIKPCKVVLKRIHPEYLENNTFMKTKECLNILKDKIHSKEENILVVPETNQLIISERKTKKLSMKDLKTESQNLTKCSKSKKRKTMKPEIESSGNTASKQRGKSDDIETEKISKCNEQSYKNSINTELPIDAETVKPVKSDIRKKRKFSAQLLRNTKQRLKIKSTADSESKDCNVRSQKQIMLDKNNKQVKNDGNFDESSFQHLIKPCKVIICRMLLKPNDKTFSNVVKDKSIMKVSTDSTILQEAEQVENNCPEVTACENKSNFTEDKLYESNDTEDKTDKNITTDMTDKLHEYSNDMVDKSEESKFDCNEISEEMKINCKEASDEMKMDCKEISDEIKMDCNEILDERMSDCNMIVKENEQCDEVLIHQLSCEELLEKEETVQSDHAQVSEESEHELSEKAESDHTKISEGSERDELLEKKETAESAHAKISEGREQDELEKEVTIESNNAQILDGSKYDELPEKKEIAERDHAKISEESEHNELSEKAEIAENYHTKISDESEHDEVSKDNAESDNAKISEGFKQDKLLEKEETAESDNAQISEGHEHDGLSEKENSAKSDHAQISEGHEHDGLLEKENSAENCHAQISDGNELTCENILCNNKTDFVRSEKSQLKSDEIQSVSDKISDGNTSIENKSDGDKMMKGHKHGNEKIFKANDLNCNKLNERNAVDCDKISTNCDKSSEVNETSCNKMLVINETNLNNRCTATEVECDKISTAIEVECDKISTAIEVECDKISTANKADCDKISTAIEADSNKISTSLGTDYNTISKVNETECNTTANEIACEISQADSKDEKISEREQCSPNKCDIKKQSQNNETNNEKDISADFLLEMCIEEQQNIKEENFNIETPQDGRTLIDHLADMCDEQDCQELKDNDSNEIEHNFNKDGGREQCKRKLKLLDSVTCKKPKTSSNENFEPSPIEEEYDT